MYYFLEILTKFYTHSYLRNQQFTISIISVLLLIAVIFIRNNSINPEYLERNSFSMSIRGIME